MDEPSPPWVAIPGLRVEDPTTQGVAENYIVLTWYPFWASLSSEERAAYLDRWPASAEWREAIIERYETEYDEAAMPPSAYGAGADASSPLSLGTAEPTAKRRRYIVPVIVVALAMAGLVVAVLNLLPNKGDGTMIRAAEPKLLLWEGAAGREPNHFAAFEVVAIQREKGGLLGIGQSPSIVGAFPDARRVDVRTLDRARNTITLRAPGASLPAGVAPGQRVVLGLVDDAHFICIFIPGPEVAPEALEGWARSQWSQTLRRSGDRR